MADEIGSDSAAAENEGTAASFTPIESQEALDRIIGERVARERNKYADYDTLRDKAARYDAAEAANLSEVEKAVKRAEVAEARARDLEVSTARAQVAAARGVPAGLLSGGTVEEFEASAEALLKFRGEQATPRAPRPDPRQGASTGPGISGANLTDWLRGELIK
ncbi:hypothetical protein D5S18_03015 [Nocardia panacis]|uniref:DUF4355 domain-containing protein n=1 Tax=Nocardia panacis TaxID=2340916 RepID=A0A3A4KSN7_9NOCA|nr:hypothetical protein [Nocardia panacis]RJO79316.1 hypothetical protein D5S18_03015 [Nocardia panacis]